MQNNIGIRVLTVSAILLVMACVLTFIPRGAQAQTVIRDRDFTAVTAPSVTGGDALYITDNRTGQMAVFIFDSSRRTFIPRAVHSLPDMFGQKKR